ncbi:MAG: hypothetical protein R3251_01475, partial [Candidatus Spechtbacterales bacterium]|nr:hypothetical protein [Candidatus Spechtbacterales bacterium]
MIFDVFLLILIVVLWGKMNRLSQKLDNVHATKREEPHAQEAETPAAEPAPAPDEKYATAPESSMQYVGDVEDAFKKEPSGPTEVQKATQDFVNWLKEDWLLKLGAFLLLIGFGWFVK